MYIMLMTFDNYEIECLKKVSSIFNCFFLFGTEKIRSECSTKFRFRVIICNLIITRQQRHILV